MTEEKSFNPLTPKEFKTLVDGWVEELMKGYDPENNTVNLGGLMNATLFQIRYNTLSGVLTNNFVQFGDFIFIENHALTNVDDEDFDLSHTLIRWTIYDQRESQFNETVFYLPSSAIFKTFVRRYRVRTHLYQPLIHLRSQEDIVEERILEALFLEKFMESRRSNSTNFSVCCYIFFDTLSKLDPYLLSES